MRSTIPGFLVLFVSTLVGCDSTAIDYSQLKLVPVSGNVTLDGKPLAGVRVRFVGNDGSGSDGVTDAEGNYTLRYDSNQTGATPGTKKVIITSAVGGAVDDPDAAIDDERIPARYNSATELSVEVKGPQSTHDFALSST